MDCSHLAEDRDQWRAVVYTVMNLRAPKKAGNVFSILATISFSRRTLLHTLSYLLLESIARKTMV
jgi:hypothetical protein